VVEETCSIFGLSMSDSFRMMVDKASYLDVDAVAGRDGPGLSVAYDFGRGVWGWVADDHCCLVAMLLQNVSLGQRWLCLFSCKQSKMHMECNGDEWGMVNLL
jgi:hypothetical protein